MEGFLETLQMLTTHMSQMDLFINNFNTLIVDNDVNVISTVDQSIYIDAPNKMPQDKAEDIAKRLNIIDRLISTKREEIDNLFKEAWRLEGSLNKDKSDSSNASLIQKKLEDFQKLNAKYKH